MRNEILTDMFHSYVQSDTYINSNDLAELENIKQSKRKEISSITGTEIYNNLDDFLLDIECEVERLGFIMGFKHAMRLRKECEIKWAKRAFEERRRKWWIKKSQRAAADREARKIKKI